MTPLEVWHGFIAQGWQPTVLRQDEIVDLFKPQVKAITRNGMVTIFTNQYYNKMLERYHGVEVCVNYDIHDPSLVWVRDQQQRLICEAAFEANKRHYFPMPVIEQARDQRAKRREDLLQEKIRVVRLERTGTVETEIQIPQFVESEEFVESTESIESTANCQLHELPNPELHRPIFYANIERYDWHRANGMLTEDDQIWCRGFETTAEYRMAFGASPAIEVAG